MRILKPRVCATCAMSYHPKSHGQTYCSRDCIPCGTYAGYQAHKALGEPVCDDCRQARNAYMRDYRRKHPGLVVRYKQQARLRNGALQILKRRHHLEYLQILAELKSDGYTTREGTTDDTQQMPEVRVT